MHGAGVAGRWCGSVEAGEYLIQGDLGLKGEFGTVLNHTLRTSFRNKDPFPTVGSVAVSQMFSVLC